MVDVTVLQFRLRNSQTLNSIMIFKKNVKWNITLERHKQQIHQTQTMNMANGCYFSHHDIFHEF